MRVSGEVWALVWDAGGPRGTAGAGTAGREASLRRQPRRQQSLPLHVCGQSPAHEPAVQQAQAAHRGEVTGAAPRLPPAAGGPSSAAESERASASTRRCGRVGCLRPRGLAVGRSRGTGWGPHSASALSDLLRMVAPLRPSGRLLSISGAPERSCPGRVPAASRWVDPGGLQSAQAINSRRREGGAGRRALVKPGCIRAASAASGQGAAIGG